VIDGTYTTGAVVRSRLGSVTYAATDASEARVDVTIYAPECFVSPVALERSLREIRQLEKVHAPQVLRVIDAGKLPRGGIYEVHEPVDGVPFAELGAIPPAEVASIVHEVVTALQAAQKVGVLHRNLGAEAVLRTAGGIKLAGFAVGDPQGGVSFGALDCIAPEQVEGKNIDERTLVYNLAALTYRLLRGASLFTGGDSGTQLLQAAASLPPQESMPAPLFAALAKDPKSRPNLLQKFLAELDEIVREFANFTQTSSDETPEAMTDLREDRTAPMSPKAGEVREVNDTLATLMTDPDAPKQPSAAPEGAKPNTTRPAIVTGPGMITPPPSLGKPPTLGAPPSLGKAPVPSPLAGLPSLGALPSLGKPPGAPSLGAPPTIGAPTVGAPSVPTFGAPSAAPPSISTTPTAAAATASAGAKPRTRGWTMFMEVTEDEAGSSGTPGVPTPGAAPVAPASLAPSAAPVVAAPIQAPVPVQAPIPVAPIQAPIQAPVAPTPKAEVKPSTRGWTMIMDEPEDAAGLGLSTPAAAAAPPPPSPTTRGWTMLEELNEGLPVAAAPVAPAPAPATPTPPAEVGVSQAPSSRGWTMFMEAELQGSPKPEEPLEVEPEFYDGTVQTDSGTVVAFAPTAAEPNASFRRAAEPAVDLSAQEPMRSFGSRLRGEVEEAAPIAPSLDPVSVPSVSAEVPSFAGNNLGFAVATPTTPAAEPRRPAQPDALDNDVESEASGGNSKMIVIGVVVVIAIVVAVVLATR
jgi:serine/threonine protein kinase